MNIRSAMIYYPLLGVVFTAVVWAADQRYVQQKALRQYGDHQRIIQLNDQIDNLQLKIQLNEATEYDKGRLQILLRKRQELLGNE